MKGRIYPWTMFLGGLIAVAAVDGAPQDHRPLGTVLLWTGIGLLLMGLGAYGMKRRGYFDNPGGGR